MHFYHSIMRHCYVKTAIYELKSEDTHTHNRFTAPWILSGATWGAGTRRNIHLKIEPAICVLVT